jgi:hypothetical protein
MHANIVHQRDAGPRATPEAVAPVPGPDGLSCGRGRRTPGHREELPAARIPLPETVRPNYR